MYTLGLSGFAHEASCALLNDGKIVALIEEERLNREKHTWKFPQQAIAKCLEMGGITMEEVDDVTFFWQPWKELRGNVAHMLRYFPQSLQLLTISSAGSELSTMARVRAMQTLEKSVREHFPTRRRLKPHFVEHHLGHAASAFFVSPFEEAAILTMDGRGESTTTLLATGKGNKITKLEEVPVPHSLGHLYAAITDHLGFMPMFDEWKVMGMSAYGKDTYVGIFEEMVHLRSDGTYRLNLDYFRFHVRGKDAWCSDLLASRLGPKRAKHEEYDQRHFDIAFGLQRVVEKAGVHVAQHLYEKTRLPNLCMTGGVVLNCLMNKLIVEKTPFKDFFIQPIANDAGTSLGSALYHYHQTLGRPRTTVFESAYLGPEYDDAAIEKVLKEKGVNYRKCASIAEETAKVIAQNKIVGWFQGRMEAGPRALGHRSIVVNPTDPTMKDRLNSRVKRREHFRPFAPSVLEEKVADYFIMPKGQPSPYMILVGDVRPEAKDVLPAITHADGTARVQTVSRKVSPEYWDLINAFGKITGVPVLLNTSFNENEPIVCTPEHAVACFLRTEFDALAIGSFLVTKEASVS